MIAIRNVLLVSLLAGSMAIAQDVQFASDVSVRQRLQRAIDVSRNLAAKGQQINDDSLRSFGLEACERTDRDKPLLFPRTEDVETYRRDRPWASNYAPSPALLRPMRSKLGDVERWPKFLSHYRWVKFLEKNGNDGIVEMAAWRQFGAIKYPTWWVSEMKILPSESKVRYKHIEGITKGMDVEWRLTHKGGKVDIMIIHEWPGPKWPLIGKLAADLVIGPVFIHAIASRTLAGVKSHAEQA